MYACVCCLFPPLQRESSQKAHSSRSTRACHESPIALWYSVRTQAYHTMYTWLMIIDMRQTKSMRVISVWVSQVTAHFQPWCNARRDPISCNTKFPNPRKRSKIVFLKSHPGHIVNCFTVNTFAVRHFTVPLQYFEFCPEESEEKFFKWHAWISLYSVNRVGEKDNVQMFSLSRSAWGF